MSALSEEVQLVLEGTQEAVRLVLRQAELIATRLGADDEAERYGRLARLLGAQQEVAS